jgi:hypothetical protein
VEEASAGPDDAERAEEEQRLDRRPPPQEALQQPGRERQQEGEGERVEEPVLVGREGGAGDEPQGERCRDGPRHAEAPHQAEAQEEHAQAAQHVDGVEGEGGLGPAELEHRPQVQVEERRLGMEVEDAVEKLRPEQPGRQELPVDPERVVVEADAQGEVRQPGEEE